MPHPLGRLAERPDEQGRVWVTTPHVKMLERLHRDGHLAEPVVIHDSWTGKANESLFKPFYQATKDARTELMKAAASRTRPTRPVCRSRCVCCGPSARNRAPRSGGRTGA